jgi:hypothetical protein
MICPTYRQSRKLVYPSKDCPKCGKKPSPPQKTTRCHLPMPHQ